MATEKALDLDTVDWVEIQVGDSGRRWWGAPRAAASAHWSPISPFTLRSLLPHSPPQEFSNCVPRVIKASIIINFQKSGDLTASQWTKLRNLAKQGIAEKLEPHRGTRRAPEQQSGTEKGEGVRCCTASWRRCLSARPPVSYTSNTNFPPANQSPVSTCRCMT